MRAIHLHGHLTLSLIICSLALSGCGSDAKKVAGGCDSTCSTGGAAGRDACSSNCGAGGGDGGPSPSAGGGPSPSAGGGSPEAGAGGRSGSAGDGGAVGNGGATRGAGGTVAAGGTVGAGAMAGATSEAGGANAGGAGGAGGSTATGGWSLVAVDTAKRTYLDYVEVPTSGVWKPETDHFPALATWEKQTAYSALRFQTYKPGDVLTPAQIMALLPATRRAAASISITDSPYEAAPAPADATEAIQKALDTAAAMAKPTAPVDVLVPAGTFDYSAALRIGADVHLRRFPEDSGGALHATNPGNAAIHLAGDRSGALFLALNFGATSRLASAQASGIWVGVDNPNSTFVHDVLVVGNDVAQSASAHVFGYGEEGGLWAFNYAHDGYADTFHHTAGSRYCQVVGNRAQTRTGRGDDLFAFVSYQGDGDVVHHCACIANWGRDGAARGLSVVGGGFVLFDHNDIDRTTWAGVYLAQENSYQTYGTFDVTLTRNTINHANLGGSHDGLLAYADAPGESHGTKSLGDVSNRIERITIKNNTFSNTSSAMGNGHGIEIRSSVDTGEVTDNILTGNATPELVVNGTNFTTSGNQQN